MSRALPEDESVLGRGDQPEAPRAKPLGPSWENAAGILSVVSKWGSPCFPRWLGPWEKHLPPLGFLGPLSPSVLAPSHGSFTGWFDTLKGFGAGDGGVL